MTDEAREWGRALKTQMTLQRVPVKELAAAIGCDRGSIVEYRNGQVLPRIARAAAIAEALMAPSLLELCTKLRTVPCDECGRSFVRDQRGGNQKRWCSYLCHDRYRKRVLYARDREWNLKRYDTWKRRAEALQTRVDAMCWSCEPEGACRDAGCALRGSSPLPFIKEADVTRAGSGAIRRAVSPRARRRQRDRNREYMRKKREAAA